MRYQYIVRGLVGWVDSKMSLGAAILAGIRMGASWTPGETIFPDPRRSVE